MPKYEKEENVLDVETEDASFVPVEGEADDDGQRSDAQMVDDGTIVLDSGEDELEVTSDDEPAETTEDGDEKKEESEKEPGEKKPADESKDVKPKDDVKEEKKEKTPAKKAAAPDKVQTRINKITREKYDEKRRADKFEKENSELKKRLRDSADAKELADIEKQKPNLEDFDTEAEYYEKLGRWGAKMELQEQKAADVVKPDTKEKDEPEDPIKSVMELGVETYPDFDEVVRNPEVLITEAIFNAVQDSEHAVDILYHLGQNKEDTNRIAAMKSPTAIAREIGRIETLFDDGEVNEVITHETDEDMEDKIKKKNLSNAPKPVKPLGGGGKVSKEREDMSISEYRESRGYTRGGDLKVIDPRVA